MSTTNPKIFIGSSTKGYAAAESVKACLSQNFDCYLWKEAGVWEVNKSTFDNLLRMANYFDYGVFVGTADDLKLTGDKIVLEARDNVILEMALFLGAVGRHKAFLLVEDGISLPSDFDGIYMPRFKAGDAASLDKACGEYVKHIHEYQQMGFLSLYPTTALALGYYKNFLSGLVESISQADKLVHEGVDYTDFRVKVVLPKDLCGNMRDKGAYFYKRNHFVENAIKTKYRKHPAWFFFDPSDAPRAIMYDMPSTLSGIDDAIEMILAKDFQGRSTIQEVIEQREINNFRRVLQMQLDTNPFAKEVVEIIDEF